MASSKPQSGKGVDKRKREKIDQEDSSHKKKRRQKHEHGQDGTPSASPKRRSAAPVTGEQQASEEDSAFRDVFSKHKPRSQANGESNKSQALQKWRISEPMGGRMSDIDPIFSADEK
jgi:NET1-associated nuclear protein 1 (U3 small nucleolar RNA-associated protein 17)